MIHNYFEAGDVLHHLWKFPEVEALFRGIGRPTVILTKATDGTLEFQWHIRVPRGSAYLAVRLSRDGCVHRIYTPERIDPLLDASYIDLLLAWHEFERDHDEYSITDLELDFCDFQGVRKWLELTEKD